MVSEALYGGLWARDGLPLSDRYICVLTGPALNNEAQLRRHIHGALKVGLCPRNPRSIRKAGLYGGSPTAEKRRECRA